MCKLIKMINYVFWAQQVGVDPPQGEIPRCYLLLDMNPVRENVGKACGVLR